MQRACDTRKLDKNEMEHSCGARVHRHIHYDILVDTANLNNGRRSAEDHEVLVTL